jgi:hypothetical protein
MPAQLTETEQMAVLLLPVQAAERLVRTQQDGDDRLTSTAALQHNQLQARSSIPSRWPPTAQQAT